MLHCDMYGQKTFPKEKGIYQQEQHLDGCEETSDSEWSTTTVEYLPEPSYEATERSTEAMEAFLEVQDQFLIQQTKFTEEKDVQKKEIHQAQLKELDERGKLLKLEEEQDEEAQLQREMKEKMKAL